MPEIVLFFYILVTLATLVVIVLTIKCLARLASYLEVKQQLTEEEFQQKRYIDSQSKRRRDKYSSLQAIKNLLDDEVLTQDAYEEEKACILNDPQLATITSKDAWHLHEQKLTEQLSTLGYKVTKPTDKLWSVTNPQGEVEMCSSPQEFEAAALAAIQRDS